MLKIKYFVKIGHLKITLCFCVFFIIIIFEKKNFHFQKVDVCSRVGAVGIAVEVLYGSDGGPVW